MESVNEVIINLRHQYAAKELSEHTMGAEPVKEFETWMKEALMAKVNDPIAMTLATADLNGRPTARVVLLREVSEKGFVFFTNYNSRKGMDILKNPVACLNFFWPELQRQVRINGAVSKLSPEFSDTYFNSRPRESRVSAWASDQSKKIFSREELISSLKKFDEKYPGENVPRPPHWGGYIVNPESVEFWQGRENRLHDRVLYEKTGKNEWMRSRLAP